ncbi:MAG: OmpA family protein [Saprospiraceae bacterium]|nr:OmpA family protein [Saprospiraceae bacterium]
MRIVVVLLLLLAWYFFSWTYIDVKKSQCCDSVEGISVTAPADTTPAIQTNSDVETSIGSPISFAWADPVVIRNAAFEAWRDSLAQVLAAGNLRITGYQYQGEETPGLGLARAAAVKEALAPAIPAPRISINASDRAIVDQGAQTVRGFAVEVIAPAKKSGYQSPGAIQFPWGSAHGELGPDIRRYLHDIARQLQESDLRVMITGHTDNTSSAVFNERLGLRRANVIRAYLLRLGVDHERIDVRSKGETEPVASNDTEAGRQANRRVELELISN